MRKIFVLPALFALSGALHAQSNYAALRGFVTDPQQRAIPQAHVRIISTVTGATREVLTDGAGLYDAEGLPPGPYRVQRALSGDRELQLRRPRAGQNRRELCRDGRACPGAVLDVPNRFLNTAGFGTMTDAMSPGRQIQLSARLSF